MKVIFLVFVIASAVALPPDWEEKISEIKEQYEKAKGVCMDKLDVSEAEIEELDVTTNKTTRRDKCILGCLLEEFGYIVNGKFSREKSDKLAEYFYDNDDTNEYLAISKSISLACEKAVAAAKTEDSCDVAGEIINCVMEQAKLHQPKISMVAGN